MAQLPPVTIVMTTYFQEGEKGDERYKAALETLASWRNHLVYGERIFLHIADDGSSYSRFDKFWLSAMDTWLGGLLSITYVSFSRQDRKGVGVSLNSGFRRAFESSPLVFYGVDDWSLTENFDITPWCQLLMEREDIGMVRLGPPHPRTMGWVEAFTTNWQGWGLRLRKDYGFAFGHRPALYHQRMFDIYGRFKEDCSALECEDDYRERVSRMTGPDVVLALPHPWRHINTISMSSMEPGK